MFKQILRFGTTTLLHFFSYSIILLIIWIISISQSYAQERVSDSGELQKKAVRIFLDVPNRLHDYIKNEIPFVNYVRERKEAQVHILLTTQRTGSSGIEHTLTLIGQENFAGMNDTLKYVSKQMDTEEIIRNGIVRILKMGLMTYVAKTPLTDNISITYKVATVPSAVVDKWDYWVFNIISNNTFNGEKLRKSLSVRSTVMADRVTPDWRISFYLNSNYSKDKYITDDRTISSITRSQRFASTIVKSFGEHWGAGFFSSASSSIYSNNKLSINVAPAFEYNVFPYAESTRREFSFLYKMGYTSNNYNEETFFNKTYENLFNESLTATYIIKERWGSIRTMLIGSNYFHDFSKNNLRFHTGLSLRVFEGLSFDISGNYSRIHDQLSLPKKGATEEEILLHIKQLATQYDYNFRIGFRYTFGSIYSNVVNPRFYLE